MSRTPIHPGEILKDELDEIGISAAELARQLRMPENQILGVNRGRRSITADAALLLSRWFGTSADFWINLQNRYELRKAVQEHGDEIKQIQPRVVAIEQSTPPS